MIIDKKFDSVKFMSNLLLLSFLILLKITTFHKIDAISCILRNGGRGECTLLQNCRSAFSQFNDQSTLDYCNYELNEVCCSDISAEAYIYQKDYFSNERDSHIEEESHNDYLGRTKHSVGKIGNNGNGRKRNNQNFGEELDNFEKNSNNLYIAKNKHRQRPHNIHRHFSSGFSNGNYFSPPGLAKKKAWNNEKTTSDDYYYGLVTKKPNRNQNNINFNEPEDNSHKWEYESTTKRNTESNNWHFPPTDFPNNHNYEKTTRQNQWPQESTTKRHFGSISGGNHPGSVYEEIERPQKKPTQIINEQQGFLEPHYSNNKPLFQGRKRKSEIMCTKYSREITKNVTGLPLTTNPNPVTISVPKCVQAQQLIVGGENTTIGEFPHMAAVGFRDRNNQGIAWNCGGTLISDQFVLTAAHCTSTNLGRPIKVRLGAHNLKKNYNELQFVDYSVIDIITHPEYKPPSKYNDIALLKLSNRVTFYEHIRPACLNIADTLSASRATATGWGKMSYDGSVSEILLKVVLNIVDNNTCNRLYKINGVTAVLSRGIVESQLCAGEFSGGKDTCQGDSGGPLSIANTKCIHHVIGVTSFGKGCAQANTAGVYTRVSTYVPWIESVVWP